MSQPSPLPRRRRLHYAASRTRTSLMDVPRLSLDALSLARALVLAATDSLASLRARPRVETGVKTVGGVAAALLALKFAKSLRSACVVGLVAGVFAHSLYADVLRKKPVATVAISRALLPATRRRSVATRDDDQTDRREDETKRRESV